MPLFAPPAGTPESARRVLEVLDREIETAFADLGANEQNKFWDLLHAYSHNREDGGGRGTSLAAAAPEGPVRRLLEELELHISRHMAGLNEGGQRRFWTALHHLAESQMRQDRPAIPGART